MNFPTLRWALVAGLAAPFALATASLAQDTTPPPGGGGAHQDHHWRDPAEREARMAEHLRAALQLEPSQQAALDVYLAAITPPQGMHDHHDGAGQGAAGQDKASLPAPERLDRMLAQLDKRRAHLVVVDEATKQFYAQLTAPQQKAFDALAPMMMRHRGGGHGMHGDHGQGGDGGHGQWGHDGGQGGGQDDGQGTDAGGGRP